MSKEKLPTQFTLRIVKRRLELLSLGLDRLATKINAQPKFLGKSFRAVYSYTELQVFYDDKLIAQYEVNPESNRYRATSRGSIQSNINGDIESIEMSSVYSDSYELGAYIWKFTWFRVGQVSEGFFNYQLLKLKNAARRSVVGDYSEKLTERTKGRFKLDSRLNEQDGEIIFKVQSQCDIQNIDSRYWNIKENQPDESLKHNGSAGNAYMTNDGIIRSYRLYYTEIHYDLSEELADDAFWKDVMFHCNSIQGIFDTLQKRLDSIIEEYVGVVIEVTDDYNKTMLFYAEKTLQPVMNTNFLTFKCPYTGDIITHRIDNCRSVVMKGASIYSEHQPKFLLG